MAITFNPSITNYKPSFAGKQKAPTSSAHVNLATAADTVSIAAKPVVKNTLGHRAKMFFAALPFGAAAIMSASCQDPVVPPTPTDPANALSGKTITQAAQIVQEKLGLLPSSKGSQVVTDIVYVDPWLNSTNIVSYDFANANDSMLTANQKAIVLGDTSYLQLEYKIRGKEIFEARYGTDSQFNNRFLMGNNDKHFLNSKGEIISTHMNNPFSKTTKGGSDYLLRYNLGAAENTPPEAVEILDVKYGNINTKNLKQACNDAVQVAIGSARTASKKAVKTIR